MMKNGMIIEKGTLKEFLSEDTFYADLYNSLVYLYNFLNIIDFLKDCAFNSGL